MKKITKEVLDIYVQMVAKLTESSVEATQRMLDLYYQIRSVYEEGQQAERKQPKAEPKTPKAEPKELSPSAKAAAFKRETLERMRKALKEKKLSYPRIAEAAGLDENRIIRIMEGKQEQVAVYRKLAEGLNRLGG